MPKSPFLRPSFYLKKQAGGEPDDIPPQDLEKKSSVLGAYANLCNVTIGAGIIGLPYAVKEAGLVAGTIMIIMCAILTGKTLPIDYSLRMVISLGKFADVNSYETLVEATYGRAGFLFVSINMFFLSYGSMVAYLTIIKGSLPIQDVLPILFGVALDDIFSKRVVLVASSLFVIVPLSMQRDMANLEKTSSFNVFLNICLVALVVGFSPVAESVEAQGGILQMISDETFLDFSTFFVGFGVCSFAFVCQDSSFIIAGSMKTPSKQRWKLVTNGAMLTCCTLELTLGITGYLAYQTSTLGNVLNNMDPHHWSGVVSRAMLATTMFFAYPINMYIARHACVVLFFKGTMAHEGADHIVLKRTDRRVILTWTLYILSLVPAIFMDSTGKVLAVTGAIAGSSLAYIVPGLTFLAIHSDKFIELVHERWNSSNNLLGYPKKFSDNVVDDDSNISQHLEFMAEEGKQHGHVGLHMETINRKQTSSKLEIFFWYFLGMPIWSPMAQIGQTKLAEHFEKEDMASPRVVKPKRVSIVKPTLRPSAVLCSAIDPDCTEQTTLLKPKAGPPYGTAGNEGVAKLIASQNNMNGSQLRRTTSLTPLEVAAEMKNEVPSWVDFYIAMAYVVLGVVAMMFGLISMLFL
ncbi:hypothetical protein ACHAXR_002879 [Thalassiosira sp. AJA248-18]